MDGWWKTYTCTTYGAHCTLHNAQCTCQTWKLAAPNQPIQLPQQDSFTNHSISILNLLGISGYLYNRTIDLQICKNDNPPHPTNLKSNSKLLLKADKYIAGMKTCKDCNTGSKTESCEKILNSSVFRDEDNCQMRTKWSVNISTIVREI